MAIQTYKIYSDSVEANIALTKLQANEIPCFLTSEKTHDLFWYMSIGHGGVRLMLHEHNFDSADKILSEDVTHITDEDDGNVVCPNCGSNNVKYGPQTKSKFGAVGWIGLIISLVFLAPAPFVQKGCHCFNCELDFQPQVSKGKRE